MDERNAVFIFNFDSGRSGDLANKQIEWARRVFAEPVQVASGASLAALENNCTEPATEAALYTDFQSRDSEIAACLLDWRKAQLRESIQTIRQGLAKRERGAARARTRIETMEKINASEPNPQLHYPPQAFEEIETEMAADLREFAYLRKRSVSLDALDYVLQVFEGSGQPLRISEQMMRLVGQSFRAQARLRAFAHNFHESVNERLPSLERYAQDKGFGGYLLPLAGLTPPIVIERRTAAYLRHLLETINQLAEISVEYLRNQEKVPDENWFPLFALLRAIVEFFYICNFELPFFHTDLLIDAEDTNLLWIFDREEQSWESMSEAVGTSRHLKRVSAEAASLVIEEAPLLKCRASDDLNRFLKLEAPPTSDLVLPAPSQFHPYSGCGLAEFDLNQLSQRIKFHTSFVSVDAILECLTDGQKECAHIANSALGGPLETMLGLAELDPRAFGLESDAHPLNGLERSRLLSRFWRATGRRRAVSMLGEEYTRKVTKAMEALGEPGPEHPTFISIALKPTIVSVALSRGEQPSDPFSTLIIADQVRLIEMLNITWKIASEFLDRLKDVHSQGKLKRIIEALPQTSAEHQAELRKRFNSKWVQSTHWVWSLLRGCAPAVWDFWIKIGEGTEWKAPLLSVSPLQRLSLLLRLFCETARLILLIEASGTGIGERLETDAEAAGQAIMAGVQGYSEGNPLPSVLAEPINYYFDPEVRFDSWIAFTSCFQAHLHQMVADLRAMNAGEPHINGLTGILAQLDLLYPKSRAASPPSSEAVAAPSLVSLPDTTGALTEAEAELFSHIYFELLAMPEGENIVFLKLLSMLARKETKRFLYDADRARSLIASLLPKQQQRVLLLTLPTTTGTFFNFLQSFEGDKALVETALESSKARIIDYFEQLDGFSQTLISLTSQLPNLLPADRETVSNILKADEPVNRDLPFLLLFACDQLVMDICVGRADRPYQFESATGKIRAFLREHIDAQFEEPSIEIFPIGGGRIACREGQFSLTGHNESFEVAFAEPDRAMSNYLLSRIASIKFSFATQILREEFPDTNFIAQV